VINTSRYGCKTDDKKRIGGSNDGINTEEKDQHGDRENRSPSANKTQGKANKNAY
jgi:hypothetical protein